MTPRLSMRPEALKKKAKVTVIIPVEPEGDPSAVLGAIKRLDWPISRLEVLLVRGRQPSRQRNLAARAAKGDWLLFLDSDSVPESCLIQRLLEGLRQFDADVAGGPNLAARFEPWLGLAFSAVLGSYFGSMSARSRYASIGVTRPCTEKELILCNMMVRKSRFLVLDGFREDLYPNEENEFLNRLQSLGGRLIYVPAAVVFRPRRRTVLAFARQSFNYGRGRMRQMRANFFRGDLVHLLPLLALVYGLFLPCLVVRHPLTAAPLLAYAAADAMACMELLARRKGNSAAWLSLYLFPLRHFAYGLGLMAGMVNDKALADINGPITIKKCA